MLSQCIIAVVLMISTASANQITLTAMPTGIEFSNMTDSIKAYETSHAHDEPWVAARTKMEAITSLAKLENVGYLNQEMDMRQMIINTALSSSLLPSDQAQILLDDLAASASIINQAGNDAGNDAHSDAAQRTYVSLTAIVLAVGLVGVMLL